MESSKILFIFLVIMSTSLTLFATPITEYSFLDAEKNTTTDHNLKNPETLEPLASLRTGRFLAGNRRVGGKTCDKYPRVCDNKGSRGPDCCKKQCVDVMRDRVNCGRCGKKCKYSEMCCKGKCVNPSKDEKHCGGCNNSCNAGSYCMYGMCSYA